MTDAIKGSLKGLLLAGAYSAWGYGAVLFLEAQRRAIDVALSYNTDIQGWQEAMLMLPSGWTSDQYAAFHIYASLQEHDEAAAAPGPTVENRWQDVDTLVPNVAEVHYLRFALGPLGARRE